MALGGGWGFQISGCGVPAISPPPGAHLGDWNVIAAAAGAQLSGAGVNWAVGRSEAARAGGTCSLNALQSSLKLSNLKPKLL